MRTTDEYSFPTTPGFLLPNGDFYESDLIHDGHASTAQKLLADLYGISVAKNRINDPCDEFQKRSCSIIIRAWRGLWTIYLPPQAPSSSGECSFLREAVNFYQQKGYQIMNFKQIDLSSNFETESIFDNVNPTCEDYEFFVLPKEVSYNQTIITMSSNRLCYNPYRIGD